MANRRTLIGLLALVALLLGSVLHAAPGSGAVIGTAQAAAAPGMPGGHDGCAPVDGATVACQAICAGMVGVPLAASALPLPERSGDWLASGDARGHGRELVPDPKPPKGRGSV
jgi:hypothetical protein